MCWSSSQYNADIAWGANFYNGYVYYYTVSFNSPYVRLGATF